MTILPMLEQGELLKNIRKNSVLASGQSSEPMMEVGPGERISILGLTCLEDTDARKRPGGLSYVMNIGFLSRSLYHGDPQGLHRVGGLSWNDNGEADELEDVEISAATGVTWRPCDVFNPSLDYVGKGDGTSYTLLLTENLQAGSWWDTETTKLGFGLPVPDVNGRVTFGQGTFFESPSQPLNTMFDGGTLTSARAKDWTINSDLKAAAGTRPRPSSNHENSKHLGGVHIIMCDGSGRFMNQNIDLDVYARLLTPNGVAYGERKLQQSEF